MMERLVAFVAIAACAAQNCPPAPAYDIMHAGGRNYYHCMFGSVFPTLAALAAAEPCQKPAHLQQLAEGCANNFDRAFAGRVARYVGERPLRTAPGERRWGMDLTLGHCSPPLVASMERVVRAASNLATAACGCSSSTPEARAGPKNILVEQRNHSRRIENIADVAAALEAADLGRVRAVHFEGMSLCEQICVAAEADIFVAGHGSGETLAAHLPKGARVIELGALHGENKMYWCLAGTLNHTYAHLDLASRGFGPAAVDPAAVVAAAREALPVRFPPVEAIQVFGCVLDCEVAGPRAGRPLARGAKAPQLCDKPSVLECA